MRPHKKGGPAMGEDVTKLEGPDLTEKSITIDAAYVDRMLSEIARNEDLSRYIL